MNLYKIPVNPGENIIRRKSIESTVTIPYEQTFRNIDKERPGQRLQKTFNYYSVFIHLFCLLFSKVVANNKLEV